MHSTHVMLDDLVTGTGKVDVKRLNTVEEKLTSLEQVAQMEHDKALRNEATILGLIEELKILKRKNTI